MFCYICGHCDVLDARQMSLHEVDNPDSVSFVISTPIFKWYVIRCGSKNRYQKDVCSEEIGPHAQNLTAFLGSIVNIIRGDIYDHLLISMRILHFTMSKIFMRKVIMASIWTCYPSCTNHMFHILGNWAS